MAKEKKSEMNQSASDESAINAIGSRINATINNTLSLTAEVAYQGSRSHYQGSALSAVSYPA